MHGPNKDVHALIFRRHMTIDEQGHENNTLVVVKINGDTACVFDHIDAKKHPDANVLARALPFCTEHPWALQHLSEPHPRQ